MKVTPTKSNIMKDDQSMQSERTHSGEVSINGVRYKENRGTYSGAAMNVAPIYTKVLGSRPYLAGDPELDAVLGKLVQNNNKITAGDEYKDYAEIIEVDAMLLRQAKGDRATDEDFPPAEILTHRVWVVRSKQGNYVAKSQKVADWTAPTKSSEAWPLVTTPESWTLPSPV